MTDKIRDNVLAGTRRALEDHRKRHPIWEDGHMSAADEHLHRMIADGINHTLNNYGGPGTGGGYADRDRWKAMSAEELTAEVGKWLRMSLVPVLSGVHTEVNAESVAIIEHLKGELIEARRQLAALGVDASSPSVRSEVPAASELPDQASLLEDLEAFDDRS